MSGNRKFPGAKAHLVAATVCFVVAGVAPPVLMAILGLAQVCVWNVVSAPHPWGFGCLRFYVIPPIPWTIAACRAGCLFFAISAMLALARRWIKFPSWAPVILAFPVAFTAIARPFWCGGVLPLLAAVGFSSYWLPLSKYNAIRACPAPKLIKRSVAALLLLVVLVLAAFLGSYWNAKRLADACLARHGRSARCIRASFILYSSVGPELVFPCWAFQYHGLGRIYVSIPAYEVFQSGLALDPVPFLGVLP